MSVSARGALILALTIGAMNPLLAQAPTSVHDACVNAAPDARAKLLCKAQRERAVTGLRQSLAKAGIVLEPDARMIDEYQRSGRWDLMRALQLSHGRRVSTQAGQ